MFELAYFSPGTKVELNGLTLNSPESKWLCTSLTGLGSPASRFESGERVNAHGSWALKSYLTSRTLELGGSFHSESAADADAAISELSEAAALEDVPLTIYLASGPITAMVRRNSDVKYDRVRPGWYRWNVSVLALDPHLYVESAAVDLLTRIPYTVGGLVLPATVPWHLSSTSTDDEVTYSNSYPSGSYTYRINGPINNPLVLHTNSDGMYTLRWSLNMTSGEWLDVYPEDKYSMLNGVSVRAPAIRQWSKLGKGANSWKLRATSYSANATATVYVRPSV